MSKILLIVFLIFTLISISNAVCCSACKQSKILLPSTSYQKLIDTFSSDIIKGITTSSNFVNVLKGLPIQFEQQFMKYTKIIQSPNFSCQSLVGYTPTTLDQAFAKEQKIVQEYNIKWTATMQLFRSSWLRYYKASSRNTVCFQYQGGNDTIYTLPTNLKKCLQYVGLKHHIDEFEVQDSASCFSGYNCVITQPASVFTQYEEGDVLYDENFAAFLQGMKFPLETNILGVTSKEMNRGYGWEIANVLVNHAFCYYTDFVLKLSGTCGAFCTAC